MKKLTEITKEDWENLYIKGGKSICELSDIFKVSTRTIHKKLKQFGVKLRKPGNKEIEIDKDILVDMYVNKKMSINLIASDFGCSTRTVYRRLLEFGLCAPKEGYEKIGKIYREIKDYLGSIDYIWLDGDENRIYKAKDKIRVVCDKGHNRTPMVKKLLDGAGCKRCHLESRRLDYDFVKSEFEKRGYELLSKEYINNSTKLKYKCPVGHIGEISYHTFCGAGNRCYECSGRKPHTIEFLRGYFSAAGYTLLSNDYKDNKDKLDYICPEGHAGKIRWNDFQQGHRCPQCFVVSSGEEKEIASFIKELGFKIETNKRDIIPPYELDIFVPDKKVAIEYCGLYWHSEAAGGKERKYHRNKMDLCNKKGIRLITIFGDEYINKPDVVKSRIKNALGCVKNRLYGRKCEVKEILPEIGSSFFNKYHLQGNGPSKVYFGLFFENKLVSLLSLGFPARAHVRKKKMMELKRMCNKPDYSVVGGASKLFSAAKKYCKENGYKYIVSYCDMRWAADEPVYEKLGFELHRQTKYTPHYVGENYTKRVRNQALALNKEERNLGKSEWELRLEQGYDRIWDCGHRTYICEL